MVTEVAFRSDETFTQKEFQRWVEGRPLSDANRYELIDGRIVITPPATVGHGRLEVRIVTLLNEHVEANKLGMVLGSSTGYELSGHTLEPDASFIANERAAARPRPDPNAFARVAPNLVVEISSTATARRDRTEKRDIYERSGVDEYWIVDGRACEVTVFYRSERGYGAGTTFRKGAIRSRALPKLRITIEKLFAA